MPKHSRFGTQPSQAMELSGKEAIFTLAPWLCRHHAAHSEIEGYNAATDNREILAEIHDAGGIDAEVLSNFIVRAVNSYEKSQSAIWEMASALELCLSCDGKLTWEAEHEAQAILSRVQREWPSS